MHTLKRFSENIKWLFIGTMASNFISVFISIFLIRKLAVADFGIYSLFMGSLSIFAIFSINGIVVAIRRFIPELVQKKYYKYHKLIIIKLYLISLLLIFITILIVYIYREQIGFYLKIDKFELYYSIFIINIFLFLQASITNNLLVTLFEQKFLSIIGVVSIIARGVLYAIFLSQLTIDLIFIIEAICMGIKALPSLYFTYKKITELEKDSGLTISQEETKDFVKRIRRFSLLSTANEMGEGGFSQISDYYFVSAYLGPFAMGLYAFPYKILSTIFDWIPMVQLNNIFKPYFITKYYEKDEDSAYLSDMFNFITKVYFFFYAAIVVGVISYQHLIQVYVFNSKYLETQTLIVIVILFYLLRSFAFPISIIIEIKEKIEYTLYAKIFAVFNVFAVIFVLEYTGWNLIGVALATGVSGLLRNIYLYFKMKQISKVRLNFPEMYKSLVIFLAMGCSMYGLSLINNIVTQVVLPAMTGLLLFQLLYRTLRPFNKNEEAILSNLLGRLPKMYFISKFLALNQS